MPSGKTIIQTTFHANNFVDKCYCNAERSSGNTNDWLVKCKALVSGYLVVVLTMNSKGFLSSSDNEEVIVSFGIPKGV